MRYRLYSIPQASKNARKGSHGRAFTYSNVQLHAATKELEIALFKDLVPADNNIHFSTSPDVATTENVQGIADRIQVCMNDLYPGRWEIRVASLDATSEVDLTEPKDFALSGGTCLDALSKIYELWQDIGWIHTHENGKEVITIGYANRRIAENTSEPYLYGKGNGLTAIKKNQTNKDEFATRLYVYGSERNLPARYYNGKDILNAESVDIRNLMLPLDKWGTTDGLPDARKAYLENAEAVAKYGVIPKTHYFDSTEAGADIYPSITGMTVGQIRKVLSDMGQTEYSPDAVIYPDDAERVDEVLSAVNPTDDGVERKDGKRYEDSKTVDISSLGQTITIPGGAVPDIRVGKIFNVQFDKTGMGVVSMDSGMNFVLVGEGISSVKATYELSDASSASRKTVLQTKEVEGTQVETNVSNWTIPIPAMRIAFEKMEYSSFPVYLSIDIYITPTSIQTERTATLVAPSYPVTFNFSRSLQSTFVINLKQIGFDINERASQGAGKKISMKSGKCEGREFVISNCRYDKDTDSWSLTCKRQRDDTLGMLFPYNQYEIASGDRFVLLDIALPDSYIGVAMERLLAEGEKLLARASRIQNNYEPSIDAKVMIESGRTLREGMFMEITDEDVVDNTTDYILIDSLSIYEDESAIPTYKATLRERRKVTYKGTPSATSETKTSSVDSGEVDASDVDLSGYATKTYVDDTLKPFADMFYWEEEGVTIGTKYNFFSEGQNAAGGIGEEEGESGGGTANIVIDTAMSDTSDNAVANKVIKAYVDSADGEIEQRLLAIEGDELGAGDIVTALGYTPADANNIPTKVSQLTDAGTYAKKKEIPTKVSQLADANDYVTEYEVLTVYDNFANLIPKKVSKLENDVPYLTASDIPETTVDVAMSDTSTNAVQNKVIKAYVDKAAREVEDANLRYTDGREEAIRKDIESDVVHLEGYAEEVVNALEADIKANPSTYVPLKTINNLSLYGTGNISIEGGSGGGGTTGLAAINVNGESFTPENGIVTLPSYPQNVTDLKDGSSYAKNTDLNSKVDKVTGKGLSTNDYTTAEKTKLAGLENYDDSDIRNLINAKANPSDIPTRTSDLVNDRHYITIGDVIIDDTMSATSTNAVANKVIKKYIDDADVAILKRVAALEMGDGGSDDGSSGGTAGVFKISVNGGQYVPDASGTVILPNYPSLTGYAKISDIPTTVAELKDASDYAKQTDLDAVEGTVSNQALVIASHAEELDALDKRLDIAESSVQTIQGDISSVNNKFTDDAAKKAIADGGGNNIVNTYATKTSLATTNSNVATNNSLITALQGKFTEDGKAQDAAKLGGQEPSYYASQGIVNSLSLRVTETEGDVEEIEQSIASIDSALSALNTALQKINTWYDTVGQYFDYDEKNNAWYVKGDFYATGQNAAGDAGDAVADIAALEARIAALEAKLN
jgi:hypothetical protein